jgi:hypothetical protein
MPFATQPRTQVHGTWPMCRVVVATRRLNPEREYAVFRALQFAQFTSTAYLEDANALRDAIAWVPGIDADAIVKAARDPETERVFAQDRADARTAAGGPTEFQGKSANTDGNVRFTAPSLKFTNADGQTLEAGGFQSFEAYDVLIANLDPALPRRAAPASPLEALAELPYGLSTQEVAAVMARGNDAPDRAAAEDALIAVTAAGEARRIAFGHDALWVPARAAAAMLAAAA